MTSEHDEWAQAQELFAEAVSREPDQRERFLEGACKQDAALRDEVASLLAHHERASPAFLRPPEVIAEPDPVRTDGQAAARIGTTIGGFCIKRVIASGGMGTVYLAEQARPRRDVALKVMNAGIASRSALRRFEYESQILARLRHPNIAQVYEAGTEPASRAVPRPGAGLEDGPAHSVPYFVMEYIPDAQTITAYAAEHNLNTRERLALFLQVCDGVHHGHQKGVIHRDLKPANILVADETPKRQNAEKSKQTNDDDARGCKEQGRNDQSRDREGAADEPNRAREEAAGSAGRGPLPDGRGSVSGPLADARGSDPAPQGGPLSYGRGSDLTPQALVKIIDFGVARSTDADVAVTTIQTDVGQLIGTVQYMSPEQCEADPNEIDIRSDVYSLGVVLYELLCGQLPYRVSRSSIIQATRIIREEPPIRPSTITGRGTIIHGTDRKGGTAQKCGTGQKGGTGVSPVKGDLETIILTALEKDREKRYQSAAELGADVRRYLNREPIAARPPTAWTHAVRWVLRHPKTTTAMGCFAIAGLIAVSTFAAVWFANARPHRMKLSDDHREAWLLSISGRELHAWTTEPPGRISFIELVDRPEHLGGGKLAVVGFDQAHDRPYPNSLCAFDADNPETLVWEAHLAEGEPLPDPHNRGYTAAEFHPTCCSLFDVFPEPQGMDAVPEIIVTFGCNRSQRVLRIYDLAGIPLYQVWQDGGIHDCYWMSEAKLLVCLGADEDLKMNDPRYTKLHDPLAPVVFAIRPERGDITCDYIRNEPGDDSLIPVWYKVLIPPEVNDVLVVNSLVFPLSPHNPGRNVHVDVRAREMPQLGVSVTLDEDGKETGVRYPSDLYRNHQKLHPPGDPERLPDPKTGFYFGDLPPIAKREGSNVGSDRLQTGPTG